MSYIPSMQHAPINDRKLKELSDLELIEQILQKGDTRCFSILYKRYFRKVYYQVISYVKNPEEAEDLSHDIFVKLYDKLSRFQGRSSFSTWLFSFSRNAALDYLRQRGNLKEQAIDESQLTQIPEVGDDELLQIRSDRLVVILDLLTADEKAILIMKYAHEWQINEIAEAMGLGETSVMENPFKQYSPPGDPPKEAIESEVMSSIRFKSHMFAMLGFFIGILSISGSESLHSNSDSISDSSDSYNS